MSDYIVTQEGLISSNELMHYAKGSTKKNAKYVSRKLVNGKWVYTYNKPGKTPRNAAINNEMDKANYGAIRHDTKFTKDSPENMAGKTVKQVSDTHYSNAESLKRKQASAQRNVQNSLSYKFRSKKAYYTNKAKNFLKKFTVPLRYGPKVTKHEAVTNTKRGELSFVRIDKYLDTKRQKYVNLGKGFIKKYGL